MYSTLRPMLFQLDPELAHWLTLKSLHLTNSLGLIKPHSLGHPLSLMGLTFPNPIGLAAGLDKNGDYIDALGALGFGFIEVGSVTPQPQLGNPKPRLFRIPSAHALINRMGFNNKGVSYLVEKIKYRRYAGILGVNIGKNKDTPLDHAERDYIYCLEAVYAYADYITVNISSPNTPELRQLQAQNYLEKLLYALKKTQVVLAKKYNKTVPLLVKIAPDLQESEVYNLAQQVVRHEFAAIIATNTTIDIPPQPDFYYQGQLLSGGLSGAPLLHKANKILRMLVQAVDHQIPIIGVGGILSAEDVQEKFAAGAALVQLYTGLIYAGPQLLADISEKSPQ